jgi:hypothetical protein
MDIGAGIVTGVIGMFSVATFLTGQVLVSALLAVIAALGLGWYVTVTYLQAVAADRVHHWDFGDKSTLFQDAAGATPVAEDGQPVRHVKPVRPRVATKVWWGKGALDEPQKETW